MIPANFEYEAPGTLKKALELLNTYGEDAKILAGGHSLIPMMSMICFSKAHH
jgi:aerobic carbon-monoxide dehydrogenase medium subunit